MAKRLNKNLVGGLTALAFVVITAAGVFMVSALREVDPEQFARKAEGFAEAGDYDKAAIYYFRAFRVSDPNNPKYLVGVGNMQELNGEERRALQAWFQAVTMDPRLVEAQEKILDIYFSSRMWLRVKETAEAILQFEEKHPKALHALGIALIQLANQPGGDREKGLANLEEAHQVAPEVFEYAQSLVQYRLRDAARLVQTDQDQARRRISEAFGLVKALVAKHEQPGEDAANARALYAQLLASSFPPQYEAIFLDVVHEQLGGKDRYAEAEKLFEQAVEMAGADAEVRSEALVALARYWNRRSGTETDTSTAERHLEKARSLARQAIETWPTGFNSYSLLAQMYSNAREFEKAAQVCVERTNLPIERKGFEANRQKRNRVRLLLSAAEQYVMAASLGDLAGGSDERNTLLKQAEQLVVDAQAEVADPDRHGQSLHILGKIKLTEGREREALAYFERAEKADGTPSWQNKRFLGMLYLKQGQIGAAKRILLQATRDPRADAQTWLTLARTHLAHDDPESAILAADMALQRSPGLPAALRVKLSANQKLGRESDVARIMDELDQGQPEYSVYRAQSLVRQEKFEQAYEMLKRVLTQKPTSERALRLLSFLAAKLDRLDEARRFAEEAAQADPDNLNLQALAYRLDPNLTVEQRQEKLLKSIQATPDEYSRASRLGAFYRSTDKAQEALEQYRQATQMIISGATERAKRAGAKGLLTTLEAQLLLAIDLELWDELDPIVQTAIEHNVDGAHGMTFRGRAALAQTHYDAAIEAFRSVLEEQPSQSETWEWLGECYRATDRNTEAAAAFARAAEANPENFPAQRRLAEIAKNAGDEDEFDKRLDICLRLEPENAWVRQQELARQEVRNPQEGIERREALRQQSPDDLGNLVQLAYLYTITGNVAQATELYSVALQHPDASPGVVWRAARFYAGIDERDRALQVLSDAGGRFETNENKALLLLMAGTLYRDFGDLANSETQFRKAVDLDPNETTFVSFAEHYLALNRAQDALAWLDKGIEAADQADSPRAPAIRRTRFETLLRLDDRAAAAAAVKEYRALYPKDPTGYVLESELNFVLGKIGQAIADLTQYLQSNPRDAAILYRRARLNASRQDWQQAIHDLEDLRALDPDALDYAPRILLARAYDQTDRSDLARSELKTLYEEHPNHETICRQYYQYFMQHEQFVDAKRVATALVNREPDNPRWHLHLGRVSARLHDDVQALASMRRAAEKSGYAWRYCVTLLDQYADLKNYDAGIRFYEETLPADERPRAPIIYRYAALLARVGRTDQAVTAYRQALVEEAARSEALFVLEVASSAAQALGLSQAVELFRHEPTDERLKRPNQHILAILLTSFDQKPEALKVLDSLINTSTSDLERASLYGRKGSIAESDGDYQLAKQYYEESIKAHADNYVVLNNMAYLLADKLGKPQEAVPYAEQAVRLSRRPAVVDTLAWALVELGEYGRAIGLLSRVLQDSPEFVAGLVHLGEAYRRAGDFEHAVPQYEQALKLTEKSNKPDDLAYREQAESGLQKAHDRIAEP